MMEHPKLFVSYSHDSEEHKIWVLKLSTDLRQHLGVNVILDQWDLRIGGDLRLYMEQGLNESSLVLCICSEDYVKKADAGVGGSGYESMIMTQELLNNVNVDYLIPVVRNNDTDKKLPTFLGTKFYIDFSLDDNYISKLSELIARIYNEDISRKPPLGRNPFSKEDADFIDIKNAIEQTNYHSPSKKGTVTFNFSNNSSKYIIGTGEYEFITRWSGCGSHSIYAYKDNVKQIGYLSRFTDFPSLEKIRDFDFTSRVRTVYKDEVVVWVNKYGNFAVTKILDVQSKNHGALEDSLTFEYRIYC